MGLKRCKKNSLDLSERKPLPLRMPVTTRPGKYRTVA
jgi:hypothetical protein